MTVQRPAIPSTPLADDATFVFACHPGVPCFNQCCRLLDLPLTPYDVLRLRRCLGLASVPFLERYVLVEPPTASYPFPQVFLAMADDGRCPFVGDEGCRVYPHRPTACRLYPVARGASLEDGVVRCQYRLVQEPHCQGFAQSASQDLAGWTADQGLAPYLAANDRLLAVVQHPRLRQGWRPQQKQLDTFLEVLYNLDQLRRRPPASMAAPPPAADEDLLAAAITWLESFLYGTG